jgi:hypothetical protein
LVKRIWLGSAISFAERSLPLTKLRGVTSDIIDRLAEEGIDDITTLAYANPLRLLRNTPYDWRQVINWMDEALLIVTLPDAYLDLEKIGITGAIDLAWHYDAPDPEMEMLAKSVKLEPAQMRSVTTRLYQDAQVDLVWSLYFDKR